MIVITLFKKNKKEKADKSKLVSVEKKDKTIIQQNTIKELEQKVKKLEEAVEFLNKKVTSYNINIEKLDIHDPVLKELTFSLDKLDVKELSGTLNLGNNFGVKTDKNKPEKEKKKNKDSVVIKMDKNRHRASS